MRSGTLNVHWDSFYRERCFNRAAVNGYLPLVRCHQYWVTQRDQQPAVKGFLSLQSCLDWEGKLRVSTVDINMTGSKKVVGLLKQLSHCCTMRKILIGWRERLQVSLLVGWQLNPRGVYDKNFSLTRFLQMVFGNSVLQDIVTLFPSRTVWSTLSFRSAAKVLGFSFLLKLRLRWKELTAGWQCWLSASDDVTKGWFLELWVLGGLTFYHFTQWLAKALYCFRITCGSHECVTL